MQHDDDVREPGAGSSLPDEERDLRILKLRGEVEHLAHERLKAQHELREHRLSWIRRIGSVVTLAIAVTGCVLAVMEWRETKRDLKDREDKIDRQKSEITQLNGRLADLNDKIEDRQLHVSRLAGDLKERDAELTAKRNEIADADARRVVAAAEAEAARGAAAKARNEAAAAAAEVAPLRTELDDARRQLADVERQTAARKQESEEAIAALRKLSDDGARQLRAANDELARLRTALDEANRQFAETEARTKATVRLAEAADAVVDDLLTLFDRVENVQPLIRRFEETANLFVRDLDVFGADLDGALGVPGAPRPPRIPDLPAGTAGGSERARFDRAVRQVRHVTSNGASVHPSVVIDLHSAFGSVCVAEMEAAIDAAHASAAISPETLAQIQGRIDRFEAVHEEYHQTYPGGGSGH